MSLLRFSFSLVAVFLFGCTPDIPKEIASIFVEASPSASPSMRLEVRLPVSGIGITVMTAALVPAENILGTRIITSGEADLRQQFLLVQVNRKSAIDIMKYTKEAIGRHFVLVINDQAVGLMPSMCKSSTGTSCSTSKRKAYQMPKPWPTLASDSTSRS